MDKHKEKVLDVLVAGAVGDAFGYVIEFDRWSDIVSRYGEGGFTWAKFTNQTDWQVSDDTQMTLFALEALLASTPSEPKALALNLAQKFKAWYFTQSGSSPWNVPTELAMHSKLLKRAELYVRQAPGLTCLSALGSKTPGTIDSPINDSKGCGGVMRAAPAGMMGWSIKEAFEVGCIQAAITHGHADGYLSAGWMAALVAYAFKRPAGKDILGWPTVIQNIHQEVLPYIGTLPDAAREAYVAMRNRLLVASQLRDVYPSQLPRTLGEGWVGDEALYVALYAVASAKTWDEALWVSANHDGDSDSTATLAMQLWAAFYGLPTSVFSLRAKLDVDPVIVFMQKEYLDATDNDSAE